MKYVLYGSTALVAAGMMVGPAVAAEGVQLGIGGYWLGAAGGTFGEDWRNQPHHSVEDLEGHLRNWAFKQDVEIHFKGEVTLDIGLTIGARVELEGQTSGDQIDRVYAYVKGGFGELRFGDTAEAAAAMCYLVPVAGTMFGADSPFFNFANNGVKGHASNTNGTCYGLEGGTGAFNGNSTKVVYFSPNFAGFSLAASYAPDQVEDRRNIAPGGAGTAWSNNSSQSASQFSVAANFAHDFNGFNLVAGGGGTWSVGGWESDEGKNADPSWYNAYTNVSFSGFTVGGAFSYMNNWSTTDDVDYWVYGAGMTYNFDAWTVGVGWTHGNYELGHDSTSGGTCGGTSCKEDELDIIQATASYALGPGITIEAMFGYDNYDDGNPFDSVLGNSNSAGDYSSFEAGLGMGIRF